ncbi:MAG: isopeptide-forming domain-containing fimbrial protein, partial [Clostridia bacterium]
ATTTTKSSSYSITGSSSETLTAVDVDLGYYVVFDSLAIDGEVSETDAVTNGSLVTIPGRATDGSLTDDVTISLKGNMPEIEKEIWHNDLTNVSGDNSPTLGTTGSWDEVADYQIGDTVEFRLTVTIPSDLKAYDDYDYTIIDTLSDGLEFNNDIKIYVDSELITQVDGQLHKTTYGDLTDESSENDYTFKMDFDMINIKEGYPSQKVFYVYYTATVLEDTNIYTDYEQNNAVLEFSNNPYDSTSYGKSEDDVYGYTFEIDITKTKGDGVTALADATFALYETTTVDNILTYHQIYLAKSTDNDLEVDTFYPSTGSASDTEGNYAGVITTGDTGKFAITGLDDATEYVLVELDAPEGFNIADPVMINIKATYADNDKGIPTPSLTVSGSTDSLDITIINTSANLLPETGGIGTTVFTITGIVIMLGALAILFLIKTKKTSK